jgi:hypothetical protein
VFTFIPDHCFGIIPDWRGIIPESRSRSPGIPRKERWITAWAVFWQVSVLVAGLLYLSMTIAMVIWVVISGEATAREPGRQMGEEIGQYMGDLSVTLAVPFFGLPFALRWILAVDLQGLRLHFVRHPAAVSAVFRLPAHEPSLLHTGQHK